MKPLAIVFVLLLAFAAGIPQQPRQNTPPLHASSPGKTAASSPAEERVAYGRKMLEIAEADALALRGGNRAYALLRIAQCHAGTNKSKAVDFLESAMTATREMDDDKVDTRGQLQWQVLVALIPLAPERVEEQLGWVDAKWRARVLNSLLFHYEDKKQLDRAVEAIFRLSQEAEFPYAPAIGLMERLPERDSGLLAQLFTAAYASYRDHAPHRIRAIGLTFDDMIVRYWRQIPANLVEDAIDETLKQAEAAGTENEGGGISLATANGSVSLSEEEFLLFELLPVLRELNPGKAERLIREHESLKATLAKYPKGLQSLQDSKQSIGMSYSAGTQSPGDALAAEEAARSAKIVADAKAHPRDALAQLMTLPGTTRANGLQDLADAVSKNDPGVAKEALQRMTDSVSEMNDNDLGLMGVSLLARGARIYMQMGDRESARKIVEKGFTLAERLYKTDNNADDPNKALKALWPSTEAYVQLSRVAGEISPAWALRQLNEIGDSECRAFVESSLAAAWLGVSRGESWVAILRKNEYRTLMRLEDDHQRTTRIVY